MEKPTYEMTVDGFTVSASYDIYRNGEKVSSFVSMNFKLGQPISPKEALLAEAEGSEYVTRAAVLNALARGQVTKDVAQEMLEDHDARSSAIKVVIRRWISGEPGDDGADVSSPPT